MPLTRRQDCELPVKPEPTPVSLASERNGPVEGPCFSSYAPTREHKGLYARSCHRPLFERFELRTALSLSPPSRRFDPNCSLPWGSY